MPLDNFLANGIAAKLLAKLCAPYRHVTAPVRRHREPTINKGSDLGLGELPSTPLRNAGQICRGLTQSSCYRAMAPPIAAVAGTTILLKILQANRHLGLRKAPSILSFGNDKGTQ